MLLPGCSPACSSLRVLSLSLALLLSLDLGHSWRGRTWGLALASPQVPSTRAQAFANPNSTLTGYPPSLIALQPGHCLGVLERHLDPPWECGAAPAFARQEFPFGLVRVPCTHGKALLWLNPGPRSPSKLGEHLVLAIDHHSTSTRCPRHLGC